MTALDRRTSTEPQALACATTRFARQDILTSSLLIIVIVGSAGAVLPPAQTQGIAFDDRGHMFASSFNMHTIVEFHESGIPLQTITAGGMSQPRSLAFAPVNTPAIPAVSTPALAVMVLTILLAGALIMSRRRVNDTRR